MNHNVGRDSPSKEQMTKTVWRSLSDGKLQEALQVCRRLNSMHAEYAEGWHVASHLALKLGMPDKGLLFIDRALDREGGNSLFLLQKARSYKAMGRLSDAMALARDLMSVNYQACNLCSALGDLLSELLLYPEAERVYLEAHKLDEDNNRILFNLIATQRFIGKFEQAEHNCNLLISKTPDDGEVYLLRSELRRQTPQDNHVEQLQAVCERKIGAWQDESKVCNALAKEYEDIGEYKKSFFFLKNSADMRRAHMQYAVGPDLQVMQNIREVFTQQLLSDTPPGHESNEPIFILGLPRTGSTLVERILDSHSQVQSAGELNNFARQLTLLARREKTAGKIDRMELVKLTSKLDFSKLGDSYVASTRPYTGDAPHFIDKMPLNFLYAGLIHLALPNAKIVHLRRDPMDTCYAIYKKLFRDAYPFSYDMQELAQYYIAYHKLMEHWHKVMPNVIYDITYEDLVKNFAVETQNLLLHCGLPWEEQCLEYHKSKSVSTTASASQVRQQVYSSSVGKWRMYEKQLQPLQAYLIDHGINCA